MKHQLLLSFIAAIIVHALVLAPYKDLSRSSIGYAPEELIEVELLAKKKPTPPKKKIIKKKKSKPKPKKVIEPPKNEPEIIEDTEASESVEENQKPVYPRIAIRKNWEGTCHFLVEVLANGSIGEIKLVQSSGKKILDNAAIKAIKTWAFIPATKNGKAVRSWLKVPIEFKLQ